MQAIILAGGFGTRLGSVVSDVPKAMASVAGRPFLAWLLDYAAAQGVTDAVLCVHHLHEAISGCFGERYGDMRLRYSIEDVPLGTGGAVKKALGMCAPSRPVAVMNGDSLVKLNYRRMLAFHSGPLTIAVRTVADTSRYSTLRIERSLIRDFQPLGDDAPGQISAGFYIMSPTMFRGYDMPDVFSLEHDFFARHTPHMLPGAYDGVEYFIDIGVPDDYARAQGEVPGHVAGFGPAVIKV